MQDKISTPLFNLFENALYNPSMYVIVIMYDMTKKKEMEDDQVEEAPLCRLAGGS